MSRSYKVKEPDVWRMFCDRCDFIDADRFDTQPPLEPFARKGWFIGVHTDLCPTCYRKGPVTQKPHSAMGDAREVV